jgi:hypothetical protein
VGRHSTALESSTSGATVTISNGTISGNTTSFGAGTGIGNAEGGLITLTHSTVSGNTAGINSEGAGIENDNFSTVNVIASTISGNDNSAGLHAGGIDNSGTVTITGSTINGNTSFIGGGIYNNGSITITNTTISGNSAVSYPSPHPGGGGIYNNSGVVTVKASTISGNSASLGSGAGIHDLGFATIKNTIMASQSGDDCSSVNAYGSITDGGYNIDDDGTCGFSAANNSFSNTDPLLDPAGLRDNGGPTQTIALQPGSPAIDAIPAGVNGCATITSDQRGVSRPQGVGCDIGAFELVQQTLTVKIDIKPGDFPNVIDLGSKGKIPVAVLSSPDFNAPKQVNTASLKFGRTGEEASLAFCSAPQGVNQDGLLDVLCHFSAQKTGFHLGDSQGVVTGKTVDGVSIRGTDSVVVVSPS